MIPDDIQKHTAFLTTLLERLEAHPGEGDELLATFPEGYLEELYPDPGPVVSLPYTLDPTDWDRAQRHIRPLLQRMTAACRADAGSATLLAALQAPPPPPPQPALPREAQHGADLTMTFTQPCTAEQWMSLATAAGARTFSWNTGEAETPQLQAWLARAALAVRWAAAGGNSKSLSVSPPPGLSAELRQQTGGDAGKGLRLFLTAFDAALPLEWRPAGAMLRRR